MSTLNNNKGMIWVPTITALSLLWETREIVLALASLLLSINTWCPEVQFTLSYPAYFVF